MSVTKNIFSGIFYTAVSKYLGIFISIIIGAFMSRLLSPVEFGTVAVVTVFISFFNLLSDFGFGPAIIQNKNLHSEDIRSIFSFTLILGLVFALIFFFFGSSIALFYKNVELKKISRLLSLSVLFYSWSIVPKALCLKKLQFKKIGIVLVIVQIFSGIGAIFLAYTGFSYYSIVYRSIFDGFATCIIFCSIAPIFPVVRIRWDSIKKILNFSFFQFLFNFINYFSRNADNLLIGKFFGEGPLGYYNKSYQLMMMPVQNLTHVITPVLFPVLSEFQDDKIRIFKSYCKVVELLAIIGFPLSIMLYFLSPELINIMYGTQWERSIPIFKVLTLTVGLQMILSSSGSIFQTLNRTDLLFYTGLIHAFFMLSGISYGIFYMKNLVDVGYGLLVAFIIGFLIIFYTLIKYVLNQSFYIFLKILFIPLVASCIIGIFMYLATYVKISDIFLSLLFKISIGVVVFIPFFIITGDNLKIAKKLVKKK